MSYSFLCRACGKYRVMKETFFNFLTPALRHKVESQKREGKKEVILEFGNACPRCRPKGQTEGVLKVRRHK